MQTMLDSSSFDHVLVRKGNYDNRHNNESDSSFYDGDDGILILPSTTTAAEEPSNSAWSVPDSVPSQVPSLIVPHHVTIIPNDATFTTNNDENGNDDDDDDDDDTLTLYTRASSILGVRVTHLGRLFPSESVSGSSQEHHRLMFSRLILFVGAVALLLLGSFVMATSANPSKIASFLIEGRQSTSPSSLTEQIAYHQQMYDRLLLELRKQEEALEDEVPHLKNDRAATTSPAGCSQQEDSTTNDNHSKHNYCPSSITENHGIPSSTDTGDTTVAMASSAASKTTAPNDSSSTVGSSHRQRFWNMMGTGAAILAPFVIGLVVDAVFGTTADNDSDDAWD